MPAAFLRSRSGSTCTETLARLSFAAITDEPPHEVAAAGHDRCIVPLKPANLMAWLNPSSSNLDELDGMLEDRDRPFYEHRLAA
jgi:putative SOS response-associated peptidase YedK